MQTARRFYVYVLSGVSLGFVLFGLQQLVLVLFDALGLGSDEVVDGFGSANEQLSVALALVAVGSPVWLIHWWFAERSVRPSRDGSAAERQSAVRALYFAGLLGILLLVGAAAVGDLIRKGLEPVFEEDFHFYAPPVASSLATILVVGAAWAYHALLRRRDMEVDELHGAAVWMPRAYLYLAAFGGAVSLLVAQVALVDAAVRALSGGRVEAFAWASSVAPAVIGAAVWATHAGYASRLRRGTGWRAASERLARLRLGYLVALLVVGLVGCIGLISAAIQPVIASALDGWFDFDQGVVALLVAALPFGLAAWWHGRVLRREGTPDIDPDRPLLAWRLEYLALALTGLAFAGLGVARLITLGLEAVGGFASGNEFGLYLPPALIGGGLWLFAWRRIERRRAADPVVEAASTVRRAGLLLVLGTSVIVGLPSLAMILYRLFGALLGDGLGGAPADLSAPAGFLIVATVIGVYHGLVLRRDQAVLAAVEEGTPTAARAEAPVAAVAAETPAVAGVEEATWEDEGGAVRPPGITLILNGPDGADLDEALARARAALPEGYRLERD